jgi:hypothetical protein
MSGRGNRKKRNGLSPSLLLAGAVAALALPSAVLAVSSNVASQPVSLSARGGIGSFTPASVDPRLARTINVGSLPKGQLFRFTPAGTSTRPDRSVTVAVRVDPETAQAISIRNPMDGMPMAAGPGGVLRIAPMAFNLGVSRGYQSFAQNLVLPAEIHKIDMPDLATFKPGTAAKDAPSRFSPRIALDEKEKTGRSPGTLEANGEQIVDVGGSYRLSRNLDVTAGVRYSQDRDRLAPVIDGKQDSQAVYLGTQFRF